MITVQVVDFEVMINDLGEFDWRYANLACAELGVGWRLPTNDELGVMFIKKRK